MAAARAVLAVLIEQQQPEMEIGRPHYETYRRHRDNEIPRWEALDSVSQYGWAKHGERMAELDAAVLQAVAGGKMLT